MSSTKTVVVVRLRLYGTHCWPEAPEHRSYLRVKHPHEFIVTCHVAVTHGDREVEFDDLAAEVRARWNPQRGEASCEHMAKELYDSLSLDGFDVTEVSVFEDHTRGAIVRGTQ